MHCDEVEMDGEKINGKNQMEIRLTMFLKNKSKTAHLKQLMKGILIISIFFLFRCWEYGQLNVYFRQLPSYHFHFFSVQTNVRGISFSEIWIFTTNTKNENKMKYPTNKTHFKRLMEKEFKTKNKIFVCIFSMKTEIEWQFSRRNAMLIVTLI